MGYAKEINCYKKQEFLDFNALDLIELLQSTSWEVKLGIIDRGNDFDWISLEDNQEGREEFINILKYKIEHNEYIGFSIFNQQVERFVHVSLENINNNLIYFDLDIGREENESEWFEWYYQNLIIPIEKQKTVFSKIEWETGYECKILKTFERN
ncbi:hypothetical protein V9L05_14570 [Bernardetia sp. Wsw4-3y2]|uniref:hypothetical protein n=1 Tax=Bernardetia sp. Wsw4-3y2 TaxID=3127471 RepID=UPI0030D2839B